MPEIHIGLAADSKIGKYMYFTIGSTLFNAHEDDNLHFHILSDGIPQKDKDRLYRLIADYPGSKLEFIEFDFRKCAFGECANQNFPAAVFGPLYIPALFDTLERVIYLDFDVTVMSSLSELWATDLGNLALAAVIDVVAMEESAYPASIGVSCEHYFNSGVLLIDCLKWREEKMLESMIEQFKERKFNYPDQDILNLFFNGQFKVLHKAWNAHTGYLRSAEDHIIHYSGKKPSNTIFVKDPEYFWQVAQNLRDAKDLLSAIQAEADYFTPTKRKVHFAKYHLLAAIGFNRKHYLEKIEIYRHSLKLLDQLKPYLMQ